MTASPVATSQNLISLSLLPPPVIRVAPSGEKARVEARDAISRPAARSHSFTDLFLIRFFTSSGNLNEGISLSVARLYLLLRSGAPHP